MRRILSHSIYDLVDVSATNRVFIARKIRIVAICKHHHYDQGGGALQLGDLGGLRIRYP